MPDNSFSGDGKLTTAVGWGNDRGYAVAVSSSGKIVVAGSSFTARDDDYAIVRYNSDGTLDTSFSDDGKTTWSLGSGNDCAYDVAIQSDGRIVVVGSSRIGSNTVFGVLVYNTNGDV